ncbi:MAG TPA: class I SAM-dependent methyltransferase [Longimicrobiales bacterium]
MTTYEIGACPACRGQQFDVVADQQQIKRELEELWQFHLRRMKPGAPIAQLFDRAIFSQQPPLHVVACVKCGTVFRNPREREHEVVETYAVEMPTTEALDSLFEQQRSFYRSRVRRLTGLLGGAGSVCEVGSYIGAFLSVATAAGWEAVGIDVNAHASAYARAHGCVVAEGALGEYRTNREFAAVVLWNCFDQLPDPHEALARATDLLQPQGVLALRVPNGAFYARVRSAPLPVRRSLLAWNNLASFPYRHGFTPEALRAMLEQHGYRVERIEGDVLVPISGAWTRGWAHWEERILKAFTRLLPGSARAPWLEVYARRRSD